jgi:hypothetical protein
MAKPSSRQELVDYCLRRLGAPVLEINVDDDQVDDLVDDALQLFQERHFDGVERMYLKYKITQEDINRGHAQGTNSVGIVTTTGTANISGIGTVNYNFYENSNFIQVPDSIIGIEKVFKFDTSDISGGMFSIKYQLFLNDLYYFNSVELLQYAMVKTYLEDIDFLLKTDKQIRFNKRQNRMYLDIDWTQQKPDTFFIIDCYRILDPNNFTKVYNDSFVKRYLTALIKRQWGINLSKYNGIKLPGDITFNGDKMVTESAVEIDSIEKDIIAKYELPTDFMMG